MRFLRRVPRQSRSRAVVDAVLVAFEERLVGGEAPEAVTIEAVSERAGVGTGSFYEYFGNKDSLLGAFIARITGDNFDRLLAALDASAAPDLETLVRHMSQEVARTYLAHPTRMRVVIKGIGRLGLLSLVIGERDRFAREMATRARRFLPEVPPAELDRTMQLVADGTMGFLASEAFRDSPATLDVLTLELEAMALGILRQRHADATAVGSAA